MRGRTAVCRSAADEDVLLRYPREQADVALALLRREVDEVRHRVERFAFKQLCDAGFVADVRRYKFYAPVI